MISCFIYYPLQKNPVQQHALCTISLHFTTSFNYLGCFLKCLLQIPKPSFELSGDIHSINYKFEDDNQVFYHIQAIPLHGSSRRSDYNLPGDKWFWLWSNQLAESIFSCNLYNFTNVMG